MGRSIVKVFYGMLLSNNMILFSRILKERERERERIMNHDTYVLTYRGYYETYVSCGRIDH